MNKKKGFTLIELLAIIVILAIIAVITVPIILNIINDAEKNSAMDSAHGYKDALQKYYATKSIQNPESELPSGYVEISELPSDFTVSGDSPSNGWVKLKKGIVDRFSLKYKNYVVTMDNDKNVTSEKQENVDPHVPDEYKEAEYLESTGTQYIDTGYVPQQTDYLELKNVTRKSEGALFSAGTGNYQLIYMNVGSNNYFKYFASGTAANFQLSSHIDSKNIKVYNNNLYIDGEVYATSDFGDDVNTDLRLFARKGNTNYIGAQVGNVMIKHDNTLVRNLVPVVRKRDNKPGLLDLANYNDNLWSYLPDTTKYGVTFQFDGEKIILSGTATSSFNIEMYVSLKAGTYTLKANANRIPIDENTYCIQVYKPNVVLSGIHNNNSINGTSTFTLSEDTDNIALRIRAAAGANYDGFELRPMLNEGTTALPYEPYGYKFYTNDGTGEFIAGPEI